MLNKSSLLGLPHELQEYLFVHFDVQSLARLSQCSRFAHRIVRSYGYPAYGRGLFLHTVTNPSERSLPSCKVDWTARVRRATAIDRSWSRLNSISVTEFSHFPKRTLPIMALQEEGRRLILSGATGLSTFVFPADAQARTVPMEESHVHASRFQGSDGRRRSHWLGRSNTDIITALTCLEGTEDVILGHHSGLLQRCRLVRGHHGQLEYRSVSRFLHSRHSVQALSAHKSGLLACATPQSGGGVIALYPTKSPWLEPYSWRVETKPWSLHLEPCGKWPSWLAVGQSGRRPLAIHMLGEDGEPADIDGPFSLLGNERPTSVYSIASPPPRSPLGHASNIIVSGYYDGMVRMHDLRRPSRQSVLALEDPFADVAIYSVACGGGAGCTVAAGTSMHGVVRVWDVRKAESSRKSGVSFFGPGKDRSPVYNLVMEHDRLFGVTDTRAWMLEFDGDPHQGIETVRYKGFYNMAPKPTLSYYTHTDMKLLQAG